MSKPPFVRIIAYSAIYFSNLLITFSFFTMLLCSDFRFPKDPDTEVSIMKSDAIRRNSAAMDLINSPVPGTLFLFSFPFMLSTLLQTLYSTTDTIVVGQFLGSSGISAVSNGSQIMQMLYAVCIGFTNGGQVLIAQAKGADNKNKLQKIIHSLFILGTILSLLLGAVCLIFCNQILTLMSTPPEAYRQAGWYIIICSIGIVFTGLYNMFSAVLRGLGDSRHPLIFVAIATGLNVILDIWFVAFLHWNVAGAALATVIGQIVSVVFSTCYLKGHAGQFGIDFDFRHFRIEKESAGLLLQLGLPMAVQMGAVQISFLFVAKMINGLGVTISAAFGVMQKIRNFPNFITQGFAMGAASMMGQNLGAKRLDRVNKVMHCCLLFTAAVDLSCMVLYLSAPEFCFRLFTQDQTVLSYAAMSMLVLAIEIPANCFMPACNSLVSAQGFVRLSFIVAMLDAFVGRIFFCWFLGAGLHLGAFGYFLGYIIGTYITAAIVAIYYFSGLWKKRAALV
jgi:putative MATE family efflux protein